MGHTQTHAHTNKRRLKVVAASALLFGFVLARPALAQTAAEPIEAGHWTITPAIGLAFGGDLEDVGVGLGFATGYNWNSRIALEGEFTILPSIQQGVLTNIDTTVWNVTANVLYHFTETPTVPYVAAGLGVGRGNSDLDELDPVFSELGFDENSTEFTFNFGGGLKRRISDRASIRGDLRYYTGDALVSDFVRLFAGVTFDLGTRR